MINDLEKIQGVKTGTNALKASGMQQEFASQLVLMQQASQTSIILRAGSIPVYDRPRAPKSGLNKSKTSNQGFLKGSIAADVTFTKLEKDPQSGVMKTRGHDDKDTLHLADKSQNTVQLPIRVKDIIRELRKDGDLQLSQYNAQTGEMRFKYKEGKGAPDFKGEFVINTKQGIPFVAHESREWDKLENDPQYDKKKGIIKNPTQGALSDKEWEAFYKETENAEFPLYSVDTPGSNELKPTQVFADSKGLIIAGDWDGLAIGHPPNLPAYATQVFNTFAQGELGVQQKQGLLQATSRLMDEMKATINNRMNNQEKITPYEQALLKTNFNEIYTDFSVQRAGCITPFEFLNNSVCNRLYRDSSDNAMRNEAVGLKEAYDSGMKYGRDLIKQGRPLEEVLQKVDQYSKNVLVNIQLEKQIKQYQTLHKGALPSPEMIDSMKASNFDRVTNKKLFDHLQQSTQTALKDDFKAKGDTNFNNRPIPEITHPDYDPNVSDLFQHGYDMRNPLGTNLDGAWLLVTNEGLIVHGQTQKQLIEVMLSGDFLKNNHIDINPEAEMSQGWDKVVKKQIELGQNVPEKTLEALNKHEKSKAQDISSKPPILSMLQRHNESLSQQSRPQVVAPQVESGVKKPRP